jgi:hypothetical protein
LRRELPPLGYLLKIEVYYPGGRFLKIEIYCTGKNNGGKKRHSQELGKRRPLRTRLASSYRLSAQSHNTRLTRIKAGLFDAGTERLNAGTSNEKLMETVHHGIDGEGVPYETLHYGEGISELGCLGNIFAVYGEGGTKQASGSESKNVLKISAKRRIRGDRVLSITEHMRKILSTHFLAENATSPKIVGKENRIEDNLVV